MWNLNLTKNKKKQKKKQTKKLQKKPPQQLTEKGQISVYYRWSMCEGEWGKWSKRNCCSVVSDSLRPHGL